MNCIIGKDHRADYDIKTQFRRYVFIHCTRASYNYVFEFVRQKKYSQLRKAL